MDVLNFMKKNNKESRHTDLIRESSKTQGTLDHSDQPKYSVKLKSQPKGDGYTNQKKSINRLR